MTLQELSQLYWLNREIEMDKVRLDHLLDEKFSVSMELAELDERLTAVTAQNYDGMPKSTTKARSVENRALILAERREALERIQRQVENLRQLIRVKQQRCLVERARLEEYIATIPDSLCRMVFTYRFINGLTWYQVSESIGMRTTEDSVKKLCYRYLEAQNSGEK